MIHIFHNVALEVENTNGFQEYLLYVVCVRMFFKIIKNISGYPLPF